MLHLITITEYRNYYLYIYQLSESMLDKWLVVVNLVGASNKAKWVSSYEEAEIWGRYCINLFYAEEYSNYILQFQESEKISD